VADAQSILTSQQELLDWFPVTFHEGGNVMDFREVKFDLRLPDRIPEQGVPRILSQSYQKWSGSIARAGLAFQMEDGFRMTDQGMRDFSSHITQITNGAECFGVLDGLMNCLTRASPPHDLFNVTGSRYPLKVWRLVIERECRLHGLISKAQFPARQLKWEIRKGFQGRKVPIACAPSAFRPFTFVNMLRRAV
jgi:hypothetical protein